MVQRIEKHTVFLVKVLMMGVCGQHTVQYVIVSHEKRKRSA